MEAQQKLQCTFSLLVGAVVHLMVHKAALSRPWTRDERTSIARLLANCGSFCPHCTRDARTLIARLMANRGYFVSTSAGHARSVTVGVAPGYTNSTTSQSTFHRRSWCLHGTAPCATKQMTCVRVKTGLIISLVLHASLWCLHEAAPCATKEMTFVRVKTGLIISLGAALVPAEMAGRETSTPRPCR